jgi:hypothetical protein
MTSPVQPEPSPGDVPETGSAPAGGLTTPFGSELAPVLLDACRGELRDLHWFRADWQRGGATTGYGKYHNGDGAHDVVVKFPVPPQERRWLEQLQPDRQQIGDVVPRLLDSGKELGGYDLAWVVMERLPHGPLDSHYQGNEVDLLIEALGRFHAAASHCPVDRPPRDEDWPAIMRKARKACQTQQLPHNQRWHKALKAVQKKLKAMLKTWSDRPVDHWCHGDVHFANAMTRSEPPHGPALLFDLAEVHAGHWIEDAVYFEHLFWGHDDRIGHRDVVKELAEQRKQLGLDVDAQWPRWAGVRRMLIAAAAPAYLQHRGNHRHLDHCLNLLEQDLHTVH